MPHQLYFDLVIHMALLEYRSICLAKLMRRFIFDPQLCADPAEAVVDVGV